MMRRRDQKQNCLLAYNLQTTKNAIFFLIIFFTLAQIAYYHLILWQDGATTTSSEMKREQKQVQKRPFQMPLEGKGYEIFQPIYDMDDEKKDPTLFASPLEFIKVFEKRISFADSMIRSKTPKLVNMSAIEHATYMYLEMMKSHVSATVFNDAEMSIRPKRQTVLDVVDFNKTKRISGEDWTYAGDTMTGWKRIDNVMQLVTDVVKKNIPGDYIETGVWRGGSSVYAKAVLEALDPESSRLLYVCDSFQGLPPGDRSLHDKDKNWDNTPYLEVPFEIVANNFIKYSLLDSNVVFAKGFFNETMPVLSKKIQKLSMMRLDGDMYESTVDVLYNLYDKLSIGGYVIMDDWFGFPSKDAVIHFFADHGKSLPKIVQIDSNSIYWKKTEEVEIQYWRYEQSKFNEFVFLEENT